MYITLLLIGLIAIQQADRPSADEIMQRVRQAMNYSLEKIPEAGLILEGKSISGRGIPGKFRTHFNRQGHFLLQKDSVLGNHVIGYDGKDVWSKHYDGASDLLEPSKPRLSLLWGALYSGLWIDKSSGMTYTLSKDLAIPDQYLLQFSHEPSQLTGTISIDKKSLLPQKCKFTFNGEYWTITWKETLSYEGMKLPRNIEIAIIAKYDTKSSYQWESVTAATKSDTNPFRPQISHPTNVTFDAGKTALLEVMKAKSGDLLVRPLVNGKEVGWFLLSTAMDDNVLHARTSKKLELETYGDEGQKWAFGEWVKSNWSRPKTISLGRITLQGPVVDNMELPADLDDASGVPIAGIIGLGTFRCSVIELDYITSQVALYDPKTYEEERGKKSWQKLYDSRGLGVEAEFEGHKGVFSLTSFPGDTVLIPSQAVKKLNLLEGRELKDIINRRGELAAKTGKLKYFEIGGHRHEDVEALFHTSETGAYSNQDAIGTIGVELLKPFQIVFDYQNRRIAFVKREVKDEREALKDAAWSAYGLGKYQEAAEKCRLAIRACEAANIEDQILADSLTLMGTLDVINGKYSQAETSLKRALSILKKTVGADHESNTSVLIALGNLNTSRGHYLEAEPLFQQALRILEKRSKENQNEIATALGSLAAIHRAQGNYQEADNRFLRALNILEKDPNREEWTYAAMKANLGSLKVSQGKYQEAMKLYQDALKYFQDRFGEDYLYVGFLLGHMARVHGFLNQHGFSDILFERSQAIKRKNKTPTELAEADQLVKKAKENITKAQLSQAEANLWSALNSYERDPGPDSQKVGEVYALLAKLKETQGKDNESAYYQKRAKQISDLINKGAGK